MTSILDFLNIGSFKATPVKGTEIVREFAKEAAHNFLQNGVALNETIVKIAQTESLTPEQIEMLVWETNKSVHSAKFASADNKYVEFPLADYTCVLKSLQVERPAEAKLASAVSNDFDLPPVDASGTARDFELSKTASGMHEGLTGPGALPLKYRANAALQKLANQKTELSADLADSQQKIHDLEMTFMKEARAAILDYPFQQRHEALGMLTKAASGALQGNRYNTVITKLATVLVRQGLIEKLASLEDLISDEVAQKCQVINGNHRLYVLLKTLASEYDRREALTDKWNVVRTNQHILDEKVRML
jgi:hypothetical protein